MAADLDLHSDLFTYLKIVLHSLWPSNFAFETVNFLTAFTHKTSMLEKHDLPRLEMCDKQYFQYLFSAPGIVTSYLYLLCVTIVGNYSTKRHT